MDLGLQGQTALVAAASRGLGKAVAKLFVEEGARVAICSRRKEAVDAAAPEIGGGGVPGGGGGRKTGEGGRCVQGGGATFGRRQIFVKNARGAPTRLHFE